MSRQLRRANNNILVDTMVWTVNAWPPVSLENGWQDEMEGNNTEPTDQMKQTMPPPPAPGPLLEPDGSVNCEGLNSKRCFSFSRLTDQKQQPVSRWRPTTGNQRTRGRPAGPAAAASKKAGENATATATEPGSKPRLFPSKHREGFPRSKQRSV